MTMMLFGIPNSQRPRESCEKCLRHACHNGNAGGIGEGQAGKDRSHSQRRYDGIDLDLGDDEAIDETDHRAQCDDDSHRNRDGQLVVDDKAGDQNAVQAGGEADGQVEFANNHGKRQSAGNDHGQRGLVQHIGKVAHGGKGPGRQDRKCHDHRQKSDDRAVAGKYTKRRLGRRRKTPGAYRNIAHAR